jgi:hypothetical protein
VQKPGLLRTPPAYIRTSVHNRLPHRILEAENAEHETFAATQRAFSQAATGYTDAQLNMLSYSVEAKPGFSRDDR